jgi:hypothetical protein
MRVVRHQISKRLSQEKDLGIVFEAIDDSSAAINFYGPVATSRLDAYNRRLEWSVSSLDVSRRLVVSFVYELPFGAGKAMGSGLRGPASWLISGWQANGVLTLATGSPVFIGGVPNNTNIFSGQRANNNGRSAELTGGTNDEGLTRWFNTSVFSIPLPYTFGTVSRTLPDTRQPGTRNAALSLFKDFALARERVKLQYRAEFFNAFNTPQWAPADTNIQSGNFGGISATAVAARQIQLALRAMW